MAPNAEKGKLHKKSNRWQRQAEEAQEKVVYWEREHSITSEELTKCRKSRGHWKRKTKAKKIQYQKVLEEKTALQKATQVLEHQLLRQESRINQVLED